MRWPVVKLSDVAEVFNGKTPSKSEQRDSGAPVLKIKDVSEAGLFKGEFESFIDQDMADKFCEKAIRLDDTLILNAAHNSDYVGSKQYRAESTAVGSLPTGEWLVARANNEFLYPRFLNYWLASGEARFKIKQLVKGIHLYPKDVARLMIPLPPLPEQKRIAAILDKADAIRRKRQQAIKLADEFLRAVFLDMFGDPVTNPKGWEVRPLKELAIVRTGNTPPRKEESYYGDYIEWIKSDNINTPSHFLTTATEYLSEEGSKVGRVVEAGSVLVTCIAGSFDCIGNAAYADRTVAFNQQINALIPRNNVNSWFLYALILFSNKQIQSASTNSMKGMVSKGKMEEIPMIHPSSSQQEDFERRLLKLFKLNDKLKISSEHCASEFMALCQKAFSGHL